MSEIIVRHSESGDIEAIRDIYAGEVAYAGTLQLPFPPFSLWETRLENLPQDMYSLVAEYRGEVAGQIGLYLEQNPRRRHVAGFGMAVKDGFQGKGIGSRLLSSAIDLAENWLNVQRVELTVYTDNEPAIALYKKYGFGIEGESSKYAYRDGSFVSVYHMARVR